MQQPFNKLEKTALDWGRTDRISLTHDLDIQSPVSHGYDLLTCKVQGQRYVGSKDSGNKQMDGQMDGLIASPPSLMRLVTRLYNRAGPWKWNGLMKVFETADITHYSNIHISSNSTV